jgi:hypothetical protein
MAGAVTNFDDLLDFRLLIAFPDARLFSLPRGEPSVSQQAKGKCERPVPHFGSPQFDILMRFQAGFVPGRIRASQTLRRQ